MTKRTVVAALVAAMALAGCSKKSEPGTGAQGEGGKPATGTGQAGQQAAPQGGEQAAAPKTPEGCNSDFSQPIEADYTLTAKCSPYTAARDLMVDGYTLGAEPGVEIRFADNASLVVGYQRPGRLAFKGTAEKPVRLVGTRQAPGAWAGVQFKETSNGSSLENVVLESVGADGRAAITAETPDVALVNVTMKGVKAGALYADVAAPLKSISGLDLREAGGTPEDLVVLSVAAAAALGAGNQFPAGAVINLRGSCDRDVKLTNQGAPYRVSTELYLSPPQGKSAILTIEAGVTVQFAEEAELIVGYHEPGAGLKVQGTAEKPVTFTRFGEEKKATPFRGITFYENARAPEIAWAVIEFAGRADRGAIQFRNGKLGKIENTIFRSTPGVALGVDDAKEKFAAFENNTFEDIGGPAMSLPFALASGLSSTNKFGEKATIQLTDSMDQDVTLADAGATYLYTGELYVNGKEGKPATLTVAPGVSLLFAEGAKMMVAYNYKARLVAKGTPEKPVTFGAQAGPWNGISVFEEGAVELENAVVSGTGEEVWAIELQERNTGSIKNVTFKGTKKGLHACGKVVTAGLKADPGVKAEEKCE